MPAKKVRKRLKGPVLPALTDIIKPSSPNRAHPLCLVCSHTSLVFSV